MTQQIYPLNEIPVPLKFGGDYRTTQAALAVGGLSVNTAVIKNRHRGRDSELVLRMLRDLGFKIEGQEEEIRISAGELRSGRICAEYNFAGSFYPLALITGFLAGLELDTSLKYSASINPVYLAYFLGQLREAGLAINHSPGDRRIIFKVGKKLPIEIRINSSYSYLKDALLIFGAASGCSVAIREQIDSDNTFLNILSTVGGKITVRETPVKIVPDQHDPRKKVRQSTAEYKREMMLHPSTSLRDIDIRIPYSRMNLPAILSFAVLRRKRAVLESVPLNSNGVRFMNYLKGVGIAAVVANKRKKEGEVSADLVMEPGGLKGRKIAGEVAVSLIEELPLLAVIAASIPESTVIRNVGESNFVGNDYFAEIANNLGRIGAKCGILEDGLIIEGVKNLAGADYGPFKNSEVALAFYLLSLAARERSSIEGFEIISDNYPDFVEMFESSKPIHRYALPPVPD